jgi:hypothetical protein
MKKSFIITIDTESDNQWQLDKKSTTQNAKYLYRFQNLCDKYGFKPVYLTDYPMANDRTFIEFAKECLDRGTCEIGSHPHAWDTPPFVELDKNYVNRPYLIEYPEKIIYEKIYNLTNTLVNNFGGKIISHRAGRWAMNEKYFRILGELGYKVDCSITPGINWKKHRGYKAGGSDYSRSISKAHIINDEYGILEVPMTIKKIRMIPCNELNIKRIFRLVTGKKVWMRPSINSNEEILRLIELVKDDSSEYIEFMMHSSEFMPGGSPYFPDELSIEELFTSLEMLFYEISKYYTGVTLNEYYEVYSQK